MKIRITSITIAFLLVSPIILFGDVLTSANPLEVDYPPQVIEGETFQVLVTSYGEPAYQAEVTVGWEEEQGFGRVHMTNEQGIVNLTAPSVDHTTRYSIQIEYDGSGILGYITVLDDESPQLVITAPSSVNEGDNFEVTVTANGDAVEDAHVTVDWNNWIYFTNSSGIAIIEAPSVPTDTLYSIYVSKAQHIPDEVEITVLDYIPQLVIDAPSDVEEGQYIPITVSADDNPVQYATVTFDDMYYYTDANGAVSPIAPAVDGNTDYLILATRSGYLEDAKWITVTDNGTIQYELTIDAPEMITENETFLVEVYNGTTPVEDAIVIFAGNNYSTNVTGSIILTAPLVENNTAYTLTATKDGYLAAAKTITIVDDEIPIAEPDMLIFGKVTDTSGVPIKGTRVCLRESSNSTVTTCKFTNEHGEYNFEAVIPGTYRINANKERYVQSTEIQVTVENLPVEVNFILNETEYEPEEEPEEVNHILVENAIEDAIINGVIGVKVSVYSAPQEGTSNTTIQYYNDDYDIVLYPVSDSDVVSFVVSAPNGTSPTFVIIYLGEDVMSNLNNVEITYDGQKISRMPIESFLDPKKIDEPGYVGLVPSKGYYCAVYIPKFSEHTITISSVASEIVEANINIATLSLYITVIVVLSALTAIPIVQLWKKIE